MLAPKSSIVFGLLVLFQLALARAQTRGGGPCDQPLMSMDAPNFPGGLIANDAPPGPFFQDFRPPFPTNAWWSGCTVANQDSTLAGPFPFQSSTTNEGLIFGMSDTRSFDGVSIKMATQQDWRMSIADLPPNDLNNRKARSWDTQTLCLQYFTVPANLSMTTAPPTLSTMDTCLVPGSPYMTFTFKNATTLLTSMKGSIASLTWVTEGQKARVKNDGGTYIIYVVGQTNNSTTLLTLDPDKKTLRSQQGFSGTLRLAKIKDDEGKGQEAILDRYVNTWPIGVNITYEVKKDISIQKWTWEVVGKPDDLLLLTWPHHRKVLQNPKNVNIQYLTLKGHMKGVIGSEWILKHSLPNISWFAQNPPQNSCLPEFIKTLQADVQALKPLKAGDFYFWGGTFQKISRLALIAEHVGRKDLIDPVILNLKQSVSHWLEVGGKKKPTAAYETNWGGLINRDGWNNSWVDFGNGFYNDHHFHYGYMLHGAAVIGKYDSAWLNRHLSFVTHFARDIGNPSPNDPHYPVTRHMGWFAGHSWASGIHGGAGSRDQESSTEAINGYYGLLLFAHVTNNTALIDYARMLMAVEILGAQTYWHLYPHSVAATGASNKMTKKFEDDAPYPDNEAFQNLTTVGNVMDWQSGAWLFWGQQKTQIAAIQILPLTPIGQYIYDKRWMEGVLPYCEKELFENAKVDDAFKSVVFAAYATVNPQKAYKYSTLLSKWGSGNSASNQLYFISTQPSSNPICSIASNWTPEGVYYIQDLTTSKFLKVSDSGHLFASANVEILATKFVLSFIPGGATIKSRSNNRFVTAYPDGQSPLCAAASVADAYEIFRWSPFSSTDEKNETFFELTAMVNKAKVQSTLDGKLLNNVNSTKIENGSSKYKLIKVDSSRQSSKIPIPGSGLLRNVKLKTFVVATPTLRATANEKTEAERWTFEKILGGPADDTFYGIRSQKTGQLITAEPSGTTPLSAARERAQAWEYFRIERFKNAYVLVHVASALAVAVQDDKTLIDNNASLDDDAALWEIIE